LESGPLKDREVGGRLTFKIYLWREAVRIRIVYNARLGVSGFEPPSYLLA